MKMKKCEMCEILVTGRTDGDCKRKMAEHIQKEHTS